MLYFIHQQRDQGATKTHALEPGIKSNNLRENFEKSSQQSVPKPIPRHRPTTNSLQNRLNASPDVNVMASRYLQNNFKEMRDNQQGINKNLKYIGEQAERNYEDISTLKTENFNLRRELELLRSVVIRMGRGCP